LFIYAKDLFVEATASPQTWIACCAVASDGGETHFKSSKLSPSGPSVGLLCLRYVVMLPVSGFRIEALSAGSATTERPSSNQTKPVAS
jgi:hypothetical protein